MHSQHTNVTFTVHTGEVLELAREIADALGIPPEATCVALDLRNDPFGRKWPEHHFEMFGMEVPVPRGRPSWPWLIYRRDSGAQDFAVQIWRQRIYYGQPPIVGELRWHPETGLSPLAISGIKPPYSLDSIVPIVKAVRSLQRVTRKTGRPEGVSHFPLRWFHAELRRAFRTFEDDLAEPAARTVWSHMRAHPQDGQLRWGTFRARLNGEKGLWPGKPWPAIREILESER